MKQTTPQYRTISIIILSAIFASLVTLCAALPPTPPYLLRIMPSRTTRTQDAARHHQEDEALAAATLQKEKDAAKKYGLKAVIEKENLNMAANMNSPHEPLSTVVSPPLRPISPLFSPATLARTWGRKLLTTPPQRIWTSIHRLTNRSMTMLNLPKKQKKFTTKEDKSSKRDRSGTSLKKSSFGTQAVAATSSVKDYKLSGCSMKRGSNSRARINTVPMSSTSEIYLKTFSWLTRLQSCMRLTSRGAQSLLAPSRK
jgi:hypothetical protein